MRFADEEYEEQSNQDELTEDQQFYKEFWTEFLGKLKLDDPGQPLANVTITTNAYFSLPPSGGTTWISAFFSKYHERVGVYLTWLKGPFADAAYSKLVSEKEAIEEEIGLPIEWSSIEGKHRISIRKSYDDVWSEKNRDDIQSYFADTVNRFINTFRDRMKRISDELEE